MTFILGLFLSMSVMGASILDSSFECTTPDKKVKFELYSNNEGVIKHGHSLNQLICPFVVKDFYVSKNGRGGSEIVLYFQTMDCKKKLFAPDGSLEVLLKPPYFRELMAFQSQTKKLTCNPRSSQDVEALEKIADKFTSHR